MSERTYIPKGCDQQGHHKETGVWVPRRVDSNFAEQYPNVTPPLEPAHAASEFDDAPEPADKLLTRYRRELVSIALVAAVVLYVLIWGPQ